MRSPMLPALLLPLCVKNGVFRATTTAYLRPTAAAALAGPPPAAPGQPLTLLFSSRWRHFTIFNNAKTIHHENGE